MKHTIHRGRRCLAILLALMLLVTAMPLTVSAEGIPAKTTAAVHLRAGTGTNTASQGVLSKGTTLTVTDTSNPEWYAVELSNGKTGYVFSEYLSVNQSSGSQNGTEIPAKTNACVRLRSGPGTNYATVVVLDDNASVTVTDTGNPEWYAVRTSGGKTGYIFSIYLDLMDTEQKPSATQKPAATEAPSATAKPSATAAPTSKPSGSETTIKAKTTAPLHLRSGAGTTYKSLGVISSGTTVTVLEKTNSEWYRVQTSDGKTGYMFTQYLKLVETSAPVKENVKAETTTYVHLRSGPGTSHYSKGVLETGTKLTVTDRSNKDWYAVKLSDGRTGYIYSIYLKITESTATAKPTATPKPSATAKPTATPKPSATAKPTATPKPSATAKPTATPDNSGSVNATPLPTSNPLSAIKAMTETAAVLRKEPNKDSTKVRDLKADTEVYIVDQSLIYWLKVKLADGTDGYLYYDDLRMHHRITFKSNASNIGEKPVLYVGPSESSGILKTLESTDPFDVLDISNPNWYIARQINDTVVGYIPTAKYHELDEGDPFVRVSVSAVLTKDASLYVYPALQDVRKKLEAGTKVTVVDTQTDGSRYGVKLSDGTLGYIEYRSLELETDAKEDPEEMSGVVIAKTTAALNLRKGPSTSYARIEVVEKGTEVTVLAIATDPEWYRVKLANGTEGYFTTEYLQIVSGDPSLLKTEEPEKPETDDPVEETPSETRYVRTTVSALNLRSGPSTNYEKIGSLSSGTVLTVLAETDNGWLKVETESGKVGYVSAEYVSDYDPSSDSAELPEGSETLPRYKTLYLNANTSGTVYWSSSDTSVATVSSGSGSQVFVYGVKEGTVTVTGKSASGSVLTSKKITITAPEAVRFAYTDPNMIQIGVPFNWIVITDPGKDEVLIKVDGHDIEYAIGNYTSEKENDNEVRVFSSQATFNKAGIYTARVYSRAKGGSWSKDYKEITVCVSGTTSMTDTTSENRRISTKMLELVASYEGYRSTVYADTLAGNIPTVGYGYVVSKNTSFYNSLTKSEAMAMLAYTLNTRTYTSEVNKFIQNNNMKMNQQQFDALVSFSYNIGAGYWNSTKDCYVRTVMQNSFALTDASSDNPYSAKACKSLRVYAEHDASSDVLRSVSEDGTLRVIGYYRNDATAEAWYKVKVDDATGWARSGNITLSDASGMTRDLAYVDGYTFGSNLLDWHKAGGNCYAGLYYRRLGEAKIFAFGDYEEASKSNANYKKNTYGFEVPDCI